MWPFSPSNLPIINSKRAQQKQALATAGTPSSLPSENDKFTDATATEIVARIQKGEWTASQVVEAYIVRAAYAHTVTNCLTEVMFAWAREQAKDLDNEFASTKKLRGPLHGVPTSFKDQFDIIGYDSTIGFTQWANNPATGNADLVAQFLAAGAVLFVKTNVPQTMFAFECSNALWGRSINPYNNKFTCGGSSGGEAALLAMDGSALGVGSDIGGSLRIPAAYCGIYSLKPSAARFSTFGARGPVPGFEGVKTVVGPMARSVDDLQLVSRLAIGVQGHDQSVPPLPYREIKLSSKLRFGYYTSDNYAKASPACKRAVLETVEALRKQGHECIEFNVPGAAQAFSILVGLTSSDGYKKMLSHLGPDTMEKSLFLVTMGPKLPSFVRRFAAWVVKTFFRDQIFANLVRSARVRSVGEYTAIIAERDAFIRSFNEEVWIKYGFDGIIAPVQAVPQLPHGGCDNFSGLAAGTVLYNILDAPAGCVPVTRVDPVKDRVTDEWRVGPDLGSPLFAVGLYSGKNPLYDPVASAGMPVGIQVVGKKWEEEKVLAMMHVVDQALGKDRGFGPGNWAARLKAASAYATIG